MQGKYLKGPIGLDEFLGRTVPQDSAPEFARMGEAGRAEAIERVWQKLQKQRERREKRKRDKSRPG
jgi:hypothetical protein